MDSQGRGGHTGSSSTTAVQRQRQQQYSSKSYSTALHTEQQRQQKQLDEDSVVNHQPLAAHLGGSGIFDLLLGL